MSITEYRDIVQGTDEWVAVRSGVVTASVVGKLLTATRKVADNETSRGLTCSLVAERLGHTDSGYVSGDMERGWDDEPYARAAYAEHRAPVTEIGFILHDFGHYRIGYSPDGLVGDDGLIEVKSRAPKKHIQTVLADAVPAENMAQCQAALLVSGRKWIDYVSFCGGMALWTKRVEPDPEWFVAILAAVETFEDNAAQIVARYTAATDGLPMTEPTPTFDEIRI